MTNEQLDLILSTNLRQLEQIRDDLYDNLQQVLGVKKKNILGKEYQHVEELDSLNDYINSLREQIETLRGKAS